MFSPWPRGRSGTREERLREAFEALGLTYLKLGQFLAMRLDLLPAELCRELEKLFESVGPVPFDEVRAAIEADLGEPLGALYAEFSPEPIASASVGQVHRARLPGGEVVAVKVQRPGIEPIFLADCRNLRRVAAVADRVGLTGGMSALEVVDEFIGWTLRELDFRSEAAVAQQLAEQSLEFEKTPWIDGRRTRRRVMTMEFVEGISLNELTRLFQQGGEAAVRQEVDGADLSTVLHRLCRASLRQLFETGLFHGDPHPGNILITRDGRIAFIDYGIFGTLTPYHRALMLQMIESVATGDIPTAFRCWADQGDLSDKTDPVAFERDARDALERWFRGATTPGAPLEERQLARYTGEMLEIARRHRARMGFATLLFWRAMVALDASTQKFPDHFELLAELKAFFAHLRGSPLDQLAQASGDRRRLSAIVALGAGRPTLAVSVSRALAGDLTVFASEAEDTPVARREARAARALAASLVAASAALALLHG